MLNVRERRRLEGQRYVQNLADTVGLSLVARWAGVSASTAQRWAEGSTKVPAAAIDALEAHQGRLPGMRVRHWEGWSFGRDGKLYDPSGRAFAAGDLMAQQYERALVKVLQRQVRDLEARLAKALQENNTAANEPDLRLRSQSR